MSNIISEMKITNYSNGASSIFINGHCVFVKYNTGDKVWFSFENNKYQVIKIESYDGKIYTGE